MMKLSLLFIMLCAVVGYNNAQTYKKVGYSSFVKSYSEKLKAQRSTNFKVSTEMTLFEDITSNEIVQKSKGHMITGTDKFQFIKMGESFQIQNNEFHLSIDSANSEVIVSPALDIQKNSTNMDFLKQLDSTKHEFYVADDKNYFYLRVIEKTPVSSNNQVTMRFNKKDNDLSQITIIYWPGNYVMNDLNDEKLEQPKLILSFSNYENVMKANQIIADEIQDWIEKDNDQLKINADKSTYKLKDLRITPPKK